MGIYGTPTFDQLERADYEREVERLQTELTALRQQVVALAAERDALRVALEGIALNAPQVKPQQYAYNQNYAIADSYYTAGELARRALGIEDAPDSNGVTF